MVDARRLTSGRYGPITDGIVLIREDAKSLAEEFVKHELRSHPESEIKVTQVDGGLEAQLERVLPLREPLPNRWLFVPALGGWTAVFHNSPDPGSKDDVGQIGLGLLLDSGREGFKVSATKGAAVYAISHGRWLPNLQHSPEWRAIRFLHDGDRYRVLDMGTPFEFEEVAAYRKRGRAKLTSDTLHDYVKRLGFEWIWSDASYAPEDKGWLVASDFTNANFRDVSLEVSRNTWEAFLESGEGLR